MRWLYHPLLLLIARNTESQIAAQLESPSRRKNQMLRRRLPRRICPKQQEWELLLELGGRIGNSAVRALITIVTYGAWMGQVRKAKLRRGEPVRHWKQRGRPPPRRFVS